MAGIAGTRSCLAAHLIHPHTHGEKDNRHHSRRHTLSYHLLATTQSQHQMEGGLLLNVVIGKCTPILKLLARKDETLLIRRDTLLVLNLCLHVINRVRRLDLESDRLACEGLDEDLHATTQTKDQMECRLLLDVVVGKRTTVLELLSREDEALLVRRDAYMAQQNQVSLCSNRCCNSIAFTRNGPLLAWSREAEETHRQETQLPHQHSVARAVHASTSKHCSMATAKLHTFLVLDLCLHVINRVRRLNLECDRLAGEGLDKDLHATTQTKDQMKCRLLLNVVVGKRTTVLELLAREDEALLVRRDTCTTDEP
jgi:hypothetical protein